jgi:hypothetical protein
MFGAPGDSDDSLQFRGENRLSPYEDTFPHVLVVLAFNVVAFLEFSRWDLNLAAFLLLGVTGLEALLGSVLRRRRRVRKWGRALAFGGRLFFLPLSVYCGLVTLMVGGFLSLYLLGPGCVGSVLLFLVAFGLAAVICVSVYRR